MTMHLLILGWNSQNSDYGFLQTAAFKRLLLAGFSRSSLKVPIVAISDLLLSNRLYNTRSHPLSLSLTNTHTQWKYVFACVPSCFVFQVSCIRYRSRLSVCFILDFPPSPFFSLFPLSTFVSYLLPICSRPTACSSIISTQTIIWIITQPKHYQEEPTESLRWPCWEICLAQQSI